MASQRQAGGQTASAKGSGTNRAQAGSRTPPSAGRTRGGKTAAGRAQSREARAAAVAAAQAAAAPPAAVKTLRWSTGQAAATDELPPAPRWFAWTTFILSLAGLGVSVYLTIEHYTANILAFCPESTGVNCTKVTTSAQSMVFGVLPVAVLGLAFYVFMAVANSPWAWRWRRLTLGGVRLPDFRWVRLASLVVGIGFVLYLVYAELFQIQAICLYCTSVHVITFVLFVFIVFDATFRRPPLELATQRR
jgi:uncharacterized membrane protein